MNAGTGTSVYEPGEAESTVDVIDAATNFTIGHWDRSSTTSAIRRWERFC